jgi:aspartate kinase
MADQIRQSRPWIVQKYGGTSVGKLLDSITGVIIPEYLQSYNVALVCSARSASSKSQGTTSLLFEAIHHATSSETSTIELDRVIDIIKDEHLEAARSCVMRRRDSGVDGISQEDLRALIVDDCETLRGFLKATWTLGEITERTQDRVLAVGEKLSCRIVAASLKSRVSNEILYLSSH